MVQPRFQILVAVLAAAFFAQVLTVDSAPARTAIIADDATNGISSIATNGGQKLFQDEFGKAIAVYVTYDGRLALTYANSNPTSTGSWAEPTLSPGGAGVLAYSRPAGVLVSPTRLHLIVEGGTAFGDINHFQVTIQRDSDSNIRGFNFGPRRTLDGSGMSKFPAATLAHNGDVLAVWWNNATDGSRVKAFRFKSEVGWSGFNGLTSVPDDAILDNLNPAIIYPSIIERPDTHTVYVFGNRGESSPISHLVFNRAIFDGLNWTWLVQDLDYETNAAGGLFDSPSLAWDSSRGLVIVAYDISFRTMYGIITLDSLDRKTHMDTPVLQMENDEWGNIIVDELTGDYYLFTVDTRANHDNGRLGYTTWSSGSWNNTLTIIDPDYDNVGISLRRTGNRNLVDLVYSEPGGDYYQLVFVRLAIHAPVLDPIGNQTVREEELLTFTTTATDPDGDTLTFSLGPGAPSGATITSAGTFTWTPTEAQGPGSYEVIIVVSDGDFQDSELITVTVNEVNLPPELATIGGKTVEEETQLSFTATANDPDIPANTLTFSLEFAATGTFPTGASITPGGMFSWTPTPDQGPGSYAVRIAVSDGLQADFEDITITVTEPARNNPPVLGPIGDRMVDEETLLSFTATARDPDNQPLTFSLGANAPQGASITPDGTFTWRPSELQGPGSFQATIIVSDDTGLSDSETITITVEEVNRPPVITVVTFHTVDEGSRLDFTLTVTDPDVPANTVVVTVSSLPQGASFDQITYAFAWTPSEAQGPGDYNIFFEATDNGSMTDTETVTIRVNEIATAPVLGPIGNRALDEETLLTFTASATDSDRPPSPLTFSCQGCASLGASFTPDGAFEWIPTETQGPGTYTVTITVSDGSLTDTEEVTINVNEVNMPPILGTIGGRTIEEGRELVFQATANDADFPVQALTFSLVDSPEGASLSVSGHFSWNPTEAEGPGVYSARIVVFDGVSTDHEDITITVNEANLPPALATIGNQQADEETRLSFRAFASDPDVPVQALTFSLELGAPSGATISPDGLFSWTPTEDQGPNVFSITVIVSDGSQVDSETIEVNILEVNKPPSMSTIGARSVPEQTMIAFTASATDSDRPPSPLTFSCQGCASLGASFTPDGAFEWIPTETQGPESYTITITVSDGEASDDEKIVITVTEVNRPPILDPVTDRSVEEETVFEFSLTAIDPDGNSLVFSFGESFPQGATITRQGDFSWTPSEQQGPGSYSITVLVTDQELTDQKTFAIHVRETDKPPSLVNIESKTVVQGRRLTFQAQALDSDIPENTLIFSLETGLAFGARINPATGLFTWTPGLEHSPGEYTVRIAVSDGNAIDSKDVTIILEGSLSLLLLDYAPILVPAVGLPPIAAYRLIRGKRKGKTSG